jgi:hypothetical protein
MAYFNTLLMYLGFGGGLLLLGLGSIPRIRQLQKPLSAAWVTIVALVFCLSPATGRWVLSLWSPSSIIQGLLVLDITPPIWWSVVSICAAFSGLLWIAVGERQPALRHASPLVVLNVLILWLILTSGSLLLMLAMWSLFDIVWFLSRSSGVIDDERSVWAVALCGGASILLWIVSLFLLGEGASGLWWLMRPNPSSVTLLLIAACIRIGFYPFQVVHTVSWGRSRVLSLSGVVSPLLGIALLYRLLSLPGNELTFSWMLVWGGVSAFWLGLKALNHSGRDALLPASYALLLIGVTGAIASRDARGLMIASGVWVVCLALMAGARRYASDGFLWSWPIIIAQLLLLGVPPSPFLKLYHDVFAMAPWGVRLLCLVGLITASAATIRGTHGRATGRVTPAYAHRWLPLAGGLALLVITMLIVGLQGAVPAIAPMPFALWGLAVVTGCLVALWGNQVISLWSRADAVLELLDLGWLYTSIWQGTNNVLSVVRVVAEVVEGSGSVLWSALILLLILMVTGG